MPDVLKVVLEEYSEIRPLKVFPFDRVDGEVRYAFYGRGKLDDDAPSEIRERYGKLAKKGSILVWKLPKTVVNMARRLSYAVQEGVPAEAESFYNILYVFAPEVDGEQAAGRFFADFSQKEDPNIAMQGQDLGYLFKRKC